MLVKLGRRDGANKPRVDKVRVFVVEDHAATARGLKKFLEVSGFAVEVAPDCCTALKMANSIKFDVLVSDLQLTDGTGWDLMRKLRKNGPVRGIAFSAFRQPEHRARSKAAGFLEHIVKGSPPDSLLDAIKRARGDYESEAAAGS